MARLSLSAPSPPFATLAARRLAGRSPARCTRLARAMGLADLHALIPVLAAAGEKSKTPFYVAGAVLAAWAVVVSVFGVTRPGFPGGTNGERGVIAVSVLLVALTITMAIVTASKPPHENVAQAKPALPIPPPPGVQPAPGAQAPGGAKAPAGAKAPPP